MPDPSPDPGALAQTIPFDVTDMDKCTGATALCDHGGDHPCRACHVKAWALLLSVSQRRAEVHGGVS